MLVGDEDGQEQRHGGAPGRVSERWVLCLEGFYLSLASGNLRGCLKGGFQQNIHQLSRCALSGSWPLRIGQQQSWGHWSLQLVLESSPWFCYFSEPRAGIQLRPRCYP